MDSTERDSNNTARKGGKVWTMTTSYDCVYFFQNNEWKMARPVSTPYSTAKRLTLAEMLQSILRQGYPALLGCRAIGAPEGAPRGAALQALANIHGAAFVAPMRGV